MSSIMWIVNGEDITRCLCIIWLMVGMTPLRVGRSIPVRNGMKMSCFLGNSITVRWGKGRDCLDDKGKLVKIAKDFLPETYVIKGGDNNTNDCQDMIDKLQSSSSGP
eukprot:scaffold1287_cov30-Cyclotella_meneghiniana.AAC.1